MRIEFAPGFQKSLDRMFSWRYAPYRWGQWIKDFPWERKMEWQRLKRGWSDRDAWSGCHYLSPVIEGICRQITQGISYSGSSKEEWDANLLEVANALKDFREYDENLPFPDWDNKDEVAAWEKKGEQLHERQKKALHWLAEHFNELWD